MRLVSIVVVCALLLAGCSWGEGDDPVPNAAAAALLSDGEERDFAPGTLTSGDVVRCRADGLVAEVVVEEPRSSAFKQTTHAWEKDGSTARLSLDFRASGRIIASCSH